MYSRKDISNVKHKRMSFEAYLEGYKQYKADRANENKAQAEKIITYKADNTESPGI